VKIELIPKEQRTLLSVSLDLSTSVYYGSVIQKRIFKMILRC